MGFGVWGLGFGVWSLEFGVWGVGCGVWEVGAGVWGVGCWAWGVGFGVWGVGCGVWGVGGGVWGLGFGVWGFGCLHVLRRLRRLPPSTLPPLPAASLVVAPALGRFGFCGGFARLCWTQMHECETQIPVCCRHRDMRVGHRHLSVKRNVRFRHRHLIVRYTHAAARNTRHGPDTRTRELDTPVRVQDTHRPV